MRVDRRGISLLEALVALAILVIGLVPLVETFRTGFKSTQMSKEHTQALYLADSVMEHARARILTSLAPFYQLEDSPARIRTRVTGNEWKTALEKLGHARMPVIGSPYFAGLPPDPTGARALQAFQIQVLVTFGAAGAPIDTDGDRKAETDMCQLAVQVWWAEADGSPKNYELVSLFGRADYNRALGVP